MFPKKIDSELPLTVGDAVFAILNDLPLQDRTRLSGMTTDDLNLINYEVGSQIAKDFKLWSGNDFLLADCLVTAQKNGQPLDPTLVIIQAVWKKLQRTHVLRLVKS